MWAKIQAMMHSPFWKWIEVEKRNRERERERENNNEEILFRVISRYVAENGKLEPSPIRIVTPVAQMERNNTFSITVFCRLENYRVNLDYKFAIPDNRIEERSCIPRRKIRMEKIFRKRLSDDTCKYRRRTPFRATLFHLWSQLRTKLRLRGNISARWSLGKTVQLPSLVTLGI